MPQPKFSFMKEPGISGIPLNMGPYKMMPITFKKTKKKTF